MSNSQQVCNYLRKYKQLFAKKIYVSPKESDSVNIKNYPESNYNLNQYKSLISNCQECQLSTTRKNFVFGCGDPNADLMLVGEAPGFDEDNEGIPFVGKAGKLLDKILHAINLSRTRRVFILNILKCRPPKNRDPLPSEIEKCIPYLKNQIKIIRPKLILALGKVAGKSLTGKDISLKEMRNTNYNYNGILLRVTYHPAALLRNQSLKKFAWEDFKWVKNQLIS
tara:strand:+ start:6962 stop:7633 length:672 start_codon:yes stop_codon:yes gene_type:complete